MLNASLRSGGREGGGDKKPDKKHRSRSDKNSGKADKTSHKQPRSLQQPLAHDDDDVGSSLYQQQRSHTKAPTYDGDDVYPPFSPTDDGSGYPFGGTESLNQPPATYLQEDKWQQYGHEYQDHSAGPQPWPERNEYYSRSRLEDPEPRHERQDPGAPSRAAPQHRSKAKHRASRQTEPPMGSDQLRREGQSTRTHMPPDQMPEDPYNAYYPYGQNAADPVQLDAQLFKMDLRNMETCRGTHMDPGYPYHDAPGPSYDREDPFLSHSQGQPGEAVAPQKGQPNQVSRPLTSAPLVSAHKTEARS